MQMLIITANKRHTLFFARWENHSFQFCREKIWISVTVIHQDCWHRTQSNVQQYSAYHPSLAGFLDPGAVFGSKLRIVFHLLSHSLAWSRVFVTKIISIYLQMYAYRWCEYAFWHCPVVKRSGAIDILLISIVDCNNGVIFTPDIQRRCQNCWQAGQQCGDVAL